MTQESTETVEDRLQKALEAESASARLQTAMAAGLRPKSAYIDILVDRFAVEPDFFVRDTLTWALIQHDRSLTLERVVPMIRVAAHPLRLRILDFLDHAGEPKTVGEIVAACGDDVPQAVVSQQLRLLKDQDVLAYERDGTHVYYAIRERSVLHLLECIRQHHPR